MQTTHWFSVATFSWIDPKSGLPEVDHAGEPPATLYSDGIKRARICRFANLLTCSIIVEKGKIVSRAVDPGSGLYMRPSYKDTTPRDYKVRRDIDTWDKDHAVFVQSVGCRTMAPELIGMMVGGRIGAVLSPGGVGFNAWSAGIGIEAAELVTAFPPIWTRLSVTMLASGVATGKIVAHSLFPNVSYYESSMIGKAQTSKPEIWCRRGKAYDGVPQLDMWKKLGWGRGNPWMIQDPAWVRNTRIR